MDRCSITGVRVLLAVPVLLAGCFPIPLNFQSPEVLAPGHSSVSLGCLPPVGGELSYRHSLYRDADFGAEFSFVGTVPSLMVDVKHEVLHGRVTGSLVGGLVAYGKLGAGVNPGFLLGDKHLYAGLFAPVTLMWPAYGESWRDPDWHAAPHIVAGASIGRRFRFVPEGAIGLTAPSSGPVGYLGVAVQYTF